MKEDLESHKFREDLISVRGRKFIIGNGKNDTGLVNNKYTI